MERGRVITAVATAATLAASVALLGCGTSGTVVDPVAQAAQVTQQAGGARIALTERLSSPALAAPVTIRGVGFVNEQQHEGQLTMDFSGVPGLSGLGGGGAEFIFQGVVLYARIPLLSNKLPGGKTWIKVDLRQAAQAFGLSVSQLSQLGGVDPGQYLTYLRATGGHVTQLGSDTIRGVSTSHYRATIDLSRVAATLPPVERSRVQAGIQALEKSTGIDTLPIDVWIDAQHRVRRIGLTLSGDAAGAGGFGVSAKIDFFAYGPMPPVSAPPANEVFDVSRLASALGRAA
jgi:hypothetical protein